MKVVVLLSISLLAAAVMTGCLGPQSAGELGNVGNGLPSYGVITIQQSANVIVALQDDPRFVVLDIRTPAEVEAGHLSGAVNRDFYSDTFEDDLAALPRDLIYLIYCRTGNRTGRAYQVMEGLGFEQVYDMGGGISQWMAANYPVCLGTLDAEHSCTGEFPTL
jgi:rhodanese-related sulfurtransferase